MFGWNLVEVPLCNSSGFADGDSIVEEGSGPGLGFDSSPWEDVVANDSTKPDPPSTLQQPPYAQELFTYQPDPFLNPSLAECHLCNRSLNAESETLCGSCGRHSLAYATGKLQHTKAYLNSTAPSIHSALETNKRIDGSQSKAEEGRWQCLPYDTNRQYMQHSWCLNCGNTAMWPGASFCMACILGNDPMGNLLDASLSTGSAGDYIQSPSAVAVPKNFASIYDPMDVSHDRFVRPDKTAEESRQDFVKEWPKIQSCGDVTPRHIPFDVSSSAPLQSIAVSIKFC